MHNIDISGWRTTRLLDLLYAMPVALGLWVEKPYELFDKIDSDIGTPQVQTAAEVESWGLDVDAQERMQALMDLVGPSEWDPSVPFNPTYGAPVPAPAEEVGR